VKGPVDEKFEEVVADCAVRRRKRSGDVASQVCSCALLATTEDSSNRAGEPDAESLGQRLHDGPDALEKCNARRRRH